LSDGVDRGPLQQLIGQGKGEIESAERPWGKWTVVAVGVGYKVKLIEVQPGHRLSLQFHHHRTEHWAIVSGRARVIVGDDILELNPLESVVVPVETAHRLENPWSDLLVVVEVQRGEILHEDDIVRVDDDYDRV
jgi:mannose-6-phosphate isomerase